MKSWSLSVAAMAVIDDFSVYFYNTDHLGNVREVVDSQGKVKQVTNYYPFGMPYSDSTATKAPMFQPYKYNGKELDRMHGLDWYDYGARMYDPVIGRWNAVDPLAESFFEINSYNYCSDNPASLIDCDGRNPIYNPQGNFLGNSSEGFTGIIYVYDGNQLIDFSQHDIKYWTNPDTNLSMNFQTYDSYEQSLLAQGKKKLQERFVSNVMTDIASHFNGTKIFDDKTFNINKLYHQEITFTNEENTNFLTIQKSWRSGRQQIEISTNGNTYADYEGQVENFASSILIHEWYSHGVYGVGDESHNHWKAYNNVTKDKIFYPSTTMRYKEFIKKQLEYYKSKELK